MKKLLALSICIILLNIFSKAQFFQTYIGDNYSGINGVTLQPASIADSRYKFDALPFGGQIATSSNYSAFNLNAISKSPFTFISNALNEGADTNQLFNNNLSSGIKLYRKSLTKSYYYKNKERTTISFMLTLTPKDAIGITRRKRTITNLDGLDQDIALLLFSGMDNPSLYNKTLENKRFSFQQMTYKETALTYARVVVNDKKRFLKIGGSIKILNGMEAMYMYGKNIRVKPIDSNKVEFIDSEFSYGYSKNSSEGFNNNLGFGLDLGVVYEYRPDYKSFLYEMDGKKRLVRRDLNKYKYRIGVSILDIGRIKFTKTDKSDDFTADKTIAGLNAVNKNNLSEINSYIQTTFQPSGGSRNTFNMNLPTAISVQADYHFRDNFYLGYVSYIPIWFRNDKAKTHNLATHVFSPRYETKKLGFSTPISINHNGQINTGLYIRLGNITVGTTNTSYFFGKRKMLDMNIYVLARFFLAYPAPKDKDGDKVSDAKDVCVSDPGALSLKGCPDVDNDGIPDYKDYCPYTAGPVEFNGCPDKDGDGVLDYLDACPDEKGFSINKGCPDKDKDGIIDIADRCVDVPGIKENNGCPEEPHLCCADSDGDGILDRFDNCAQVFGTLENKGCPTDSLNAMNNKPIEPKSENNNNEPNKKDSSGSLNKGKTSNDTITLADTPTLTVYFDKDEHKIKALDRIKINLLIAKLNRDLKYAKEINQVPTFKVLIMGYTDNDGDDAYNIRLSHKRAMAVKNCFKTKVEPFPDYEDDNLLQTPKGDPFVIESRVQILFFGEQEPVTDNSDENKKRLNRRVEIKIIP